MSSEANISKTAFQFFYRIGVLSSFRTFRSIEIDTIICSQYSLVIDFIFFRMSVGADEPDDRNYMNPLTSLIRYKYYVREQLATNIDVSLSDNLQYLNRNVQINSLFTALDLFDEFRSMEEHFFELRKEYSFTPFYESLRDRIKAYSTTADCTTEMKHVVNYLYTAVMSRLFALSSHANQISVVNLVEYMKITEFRMKNLQKVQRKIYIQRYCDEFKESVEIEIKNAYDLVQNTIIPNINELHIKLDEQIEGLVDELFNKIDENEDEKRKAEENKAELERLARQHMVANILKAVGSVAGFLFGFASNMVDAAVNFGEAAYEKLAGHGLHELNIPVNIPEDSVKRIAENARTDLDLLKKLLETSKIVYQNKNLSNFDAIIRGVEDFSIEFKKNGQGGSSNGLAKIAGSIHGTMDKGVKKKIESKKNEIKKNLDEYEQQKKIADERAKTIESDIKGLENTRTGIEAMENTSNKAKQLQSVNEKIDNSKRELQQNRHRLKEQKAETDKKKQGFAR